MKSVAIVGGGASGLLVAAGLIRRTKKLLRIYLIDGSGTYGRGMAYGTPYTHHLLNVPACKMSAFTEDSMHFLRWLREKYPKTAEGAFVPRKIYGEYLQSLLPPDSATLVKGTVCRIDRSDRVGLRHILHFTKGRSIDVDVVVLAMGNQPSRQIQKPFRKVKDHSRYIHRVWQPGALERIGLNERVLIVGTGLTMVDAVITLKARGHTNKILAVSRRGLIPRHHLEQENPANRFQFDQFPPNVRRILKTFRNEIEEHNNDWRTVIDALRTETDFLWKRLPIKEKKRFLRHLGPFWDVHRHRMAPEIYRLLTDFIQERKVDIKAARIVGLNVRDSIMEVQLRQRGRSEIEHHQFDRILNCTGIAYDFRRLDDPLLINLLSQGLVRSDELGMGLETDDNGAIISINGQPSQSIFAIGPLRKGSIWETTAIPEIRVQASELAESILCR